MLPRIIAAALGLALLASAWGAAAHPGHRRSSRLVELDLLNEPPSLKYGYVFEPSASEAARTRADINVDGHVDEHEAQAELTRLGAELRQRLSWCVGVSTAALRCEKFSAAQLVSSNATAFEPRPGKPLSLVWELRLALPSDARALELRDSWQLPEIDRTEAAIELPKDAQVDAVVSNRHDAIAGAPLSFVWNDDAAQLERRLRVTWRAPLSRALVLAIVGGAIVAAAASLLMTARRRRLAHSS